MPVRQSRKAVKDNMKLQRRHFEFIAETLKAEHDDQPLGDGGLHHELYVKLCKRFANKLADTNPQFDRVAFLEACDAYDPS